MAYVRVWLCAMCVCVTATNMFESEFTRQIVCHRRTPYVARVQSYGMAALGLRYR